MSHDEMARLVELSEARAYLSLCSRETRGFDARMLAGAVVLRARSVRTSLIVNRVIGLGVAQPATEQQVEQIVSSYSEVSGPFGVELSPHSQPAALRQWLKDRRLRRIFSSQILYREASPPPAFADSWSRATGLRVEKINASRATVLARLSCENFRMPTAMEALLAATADAPGWRQWLAFDGEQAIGGSLSYVEDGICWLGWTSVLPSHRGRWVHAGIVAEQLKDARGSGCSWITTETAFSTKERPDAAYFNLKKFGFQDAYARPTHVSAQASRG